jgi:hypothetical protein
VIYRAADGTFPTVAVTLTDMAPPDPFRRISGGRAAFRIVDLQRLVSVLNDIASSIESENA